MIDFNAAEQLIALAENDLFTGLLSESTIRSDLQNRQAMDRLSTLGSSGRQTYELSSKRQVYIQELGKWLSGINTVLEEARTHRSWDSTLIKNCEKCKNQATRLLGIVHSF